MVNNICGACEKYDDDLFICNHFSHCENEYDPTFHHPQLTDKDFDCKEYVIKK